MVQELARTFVIQLLLLGSMMARRLDARWPSSFLSGPKTGSDYDSKIGRFPLSGSGSAVGWAGR